MKEIVKQRVRQTSLSLVKNSISAIRKKDIFRTGCRIIEKGKIAIAGSLGDADENELYAKAREFLKEAVEYSVEPGKELKHSTRLDRLNISDKELCQQIEHILGSLQKKHANFYISNKVNLTSINYSISNELGLDLSHADTYLSLSFLLKEQSSTGIMDTFFGICDRELQAKKVIEATSQTITAFENQLEMPGEDLPVIIDQSNLTRLFLRDLNGKMVGNQASLFSKQFDELVFAKNFTLRLANDPEDSFSPIFDAEGTIAEPEYQTLIDQGVIRRPYTDKRTAKKFDFANTGCASGAYDSVPSLGSCALEIAPSQKTLKQLLNGGRGILVAIASGGDFTADGNYASPVQVAYLTDGENLLGRLPELTISGSVFDFFGKNFIGVAADKCFLAGNERLAVTRLKTSIL